MAVGSWRHIIQASFAGTQVSIRVLLRKLEQCDPVLEIPGVSNQQSMALIQQYEVVPARIGDAQQIATMSKRLVEAGLGWRWGPQRIVASIRNPERNVAVVRHGNRVIGFGIMEYGFESAHLLLFAVRPDCRRQKIGSRLLRWLEETALIAGVAAIYLEARQNNPMARRFYEAHGYRQIEIVPGYYSGRESAVRMVRRLRSRASS